MRVIPTRPRLRVVPSASRYWSCHTHSRYSNNDAMPSVKQIVARAKELNQPAVGLTDHGNMAGSVELYTECARAGIKAFPGSELYFAPDLEQYKKDYANRNIKAQRFHMGVLAYTTEGYTNLVRLSTRSHQNFFHKPMVDFALLAQLAEDDQLKGLAVTTGCHFSYTVQTLMSRGEDDVIRFWDTLSEWFGDSVYVEIQNHNIEHEDAEGWNDVRVAEELVALADRRSLPVVLAQDSHYVAADDRGDHESLKRLVAFGADPDEAKFPGDGFHMVDQGWMREHHREDLLERGLQGLDHLLSRHRLSIPELDSYSYSVPQVVKDPQVVMENRCWDKFEELSLSKRHKDKLTEEFNVISDSGMAGYIVLVAMVTDWMRENNVLFQTRGSAAGSMVCWLMGISNIDPIKWDLRFERFLSRDRTKPPDVDLDQAHDRRQELLDMLNTKFVAHQIGTWAKYGLDDEDEDGDNTGSLLVKYYSTAAKMTEEPPTSWSEIPEEDKAELRSLAEREMYKGMGTNAAGIVLTSTHEEFDRLVPLAYMARSGGDSGFVTQYNKDDIEALGFVKLDVLGSKTLTVMDKAMRWAGLTEADLEAVALNDRETYKTIRSGQTGGLFQLEGKSTMWGLRDLKPTGIKDIIAAMALFRPAIMNTGGTKAFIKRKHGEQEVPERHELIAKATKPTYGVLVYQEQVIDMLRGMGMGADDLTKFLKAVKASNKSIGDAAVVIESYQKWINERCIELQMSTEDQEYLHDAIAGFAEYGFNRAHASVYGITAFRCTWLATHYPVEFHAALLAVAAKSKKEKGYASVARARGVRLLRADINVSGSSYTPDTRMNAIRRGLISVKGVGEKASQVLEANAPYENLDDLVARSPGRPVSGGKDYDGTPESLTGVLRALYEADVLASITR